MTTLVKGAGALRVRAPAKINWSLRVLGRRPDGYHDIDSLFVPVALADEVRLDVPSPGEEGEIRLEVDDPALAAGPENTMWRAVEAYRAETGDRAPVTIRLRKTIPSGAGLGGGSSDAAAVLRLLAHRDGREPRSDECFRAARRVGADVPFFLWCRPSRVGGTGERIEPVAFVRVDLVVVWPGVEVSTRWAYEALDASLTSPQAADRIRRFDHRTFPLEEIGNDFEEVVGSRFPRVLERKEELIRQGARAAGMTGSGSAVFGLFGDREEAERVAEKLRGSGIWAQATTNLEEPPHIEWETGPESGR